MTPTPTENVAEGRRILVNGEFVMYDNDISAEFGNVKASVAFKESEEYNFDLKKLGYPDEIAEFLCDYLRGAIDISGVDEEYLPWIYDLFSGFEWMPLTESIKKRMSEVADPAIRFILGYCFLDRSDLITRPNDVPGLEVARRAEGVEIIQRAYYRNLGSGLFGKVPVGVIGECVLSEPETYHQPGILEVDVFLEESRRMGYFSQMAGSGPKMPEPITTPLFKPLVLPIGPARFRFPRPGDFWRRFDQYTLGLFSPDGEQFRGYKPEGTKMATRTKPTVIRAHRRQRTRNQAIRNLRILAPHFLITGGLITKLLVGELPDYETDIDIFIQEDSIHELIAVFRELFPDRECGNGLPPIQRCRVTIQNSAIANVRVLGDDGHWRKFQLVPSRDPLLDIYKFDLSHVMLWIEPGVRKLKGSLLAYSDLVHNRTTMLTPYTKVHRFSKARMIVGNLQIVRPFCLEYIPGAFGPDMSTGRRETLMWSITTAVPPADQPEVKYEPDMVLRKLGDYIARIPSSMKYGNPRFDLEVLTTFYTNIRKVLFDPEYITIRGATARPSERLIGAVTRIIQNLARSKGKSQNQDWDIRIPGIRSAWTGGVPVEYIAVGLPKHNRLVTRLRTFITIEMVTTGNKVFCSMIYRLKIEKSEP